MRQQREIPELNVGIAYVLWALACLGCCGIHRFYVGKYISGLIYLFTFGLFGLGQFMDLFLIPSMVESRNYYIWAKLRTRDAHIFTNTEAETLSNNTQSSFRQELQNNRYPETPQKEIDPLLKLLKAAAVNNNVLSLGQAVIVLELPTEQVKKLLDQAVKQDLAHIGNEPETGAIRYYFDI